MAMGIADMFGGLAIDSTLMSFVFEVTGSPRKVDAFINLMSAIGNTEVCRGGVVAIARGSKIELGAPS